MSNQQDQGPDDSKEQAEPMDELVDEWGYESFPASDPPGGIPPSLAPEPKPPKAHVDPHNALRLTD